jgi:anaerobic selenocysteine-containing dehydrogenase
MSNSTTALAMAIANVIITENLYDADFVRNHTSGFDQYKNLVLRDYSPEAVESITGLFEGLFHTAGGEILHGNVGPLHQFLDYSHSVRVIEVER